MVCLNISAKNIQKLTCLTPLAANRTPNRIGIRVENRTCRRPLTLPLETQGVPTSLKTVKASGKQGRHEVISSSMR
jgi:hypothetical protein